MVTAVAVEIRVSRGLEAQLSYKHMIQSINAWLKIVEW